MRWHLHNKDSMSSTSEEQPTLTHRWAAHTGAIKVLSFGDPSWEPAEEPEAPHRERDPGPLLQRLRSPLLSPVPPAGGGAPMSFADDARGAVAWRRTEHTHSTRSSFLRDITN